MQLGVRWRAGEPPHRSVPVELHGAIAEQEALHPAAQAWTLTWLEMRPRCALDSRVTLTLAADGRVETESGPTGDAQADEDDDWLT